MLEFQIARRWSFHERACHKGGGSTNSTNYTSNLPEYAEPYYLSLMEDAETVSAEDYTAYEGPRVSSFGPGQEDAFAGAQSMYDAGNAAIDSGVGATMQGTQTALGYATNPNSVYNTYGGAQNYDPLQFSQAEMDQLNIDPSSMYVDPNQIGVDQFNAQVRDQYMSPYQEAVTDRLKEEAILDDQRAKVMRDQRAIQAGAFGGDRRYVSDYLAEEGLMRNLGNIEAQGLQNAYENSQMQFERDRAARLEADMANQGANLQGGLGNLNALLQSGGMNQDAFLQARGMGENSRQFGYDLYEQGSQFGANMDMEAQQFNNNYGLDALNALYSGGDLLGTLGQTSQGAEMERLNQLYDMGTIQQSRDQQVMDIAYEDFINQRDYDRNALTWLSGILHGVPVTAESNVVQYSPSPNAFSQALGSGIAGYGLYNSLTG